MAQEEHVRLQTKKAKLHQKQTSCSVCSGFKYIHDHFVKKKYVGNSTNRTRVLQSIKYERGNKLKTPPQNLTNILYKHHKEISQVG